MNSKHRKLLERFFNVAGAATYIFSCILLIMDYGVTHRTSNLFVLFRRFLFAVFFISRKTPKETNLSPRDWLVAFCGSYMQNFLVPAPAGSDSIVIYAFQALGFVICIAGVMSLNESWGIVAANRGIKSSGIYRFVRHPIYAGYFIEAGAFLAQHLTIQNIIVMLIWTMFQLRRIVLEEQYLSQDEAYRTYRQKVRWRLIPFVY